METAPPASPVHGNTSLCFTSAPLALEDVLPWLKQELEMQRDKLWLQHSALLREFSERFMTPGSSKSCAQSCSEVPRPNRSSLVMNKTSMTSCPSAMHCNTMTSGETPLPTRRLASVHETNSSMSLRISAEMKESLQKMRENGYGRNETEKKEVLASLVLRDGYLGYMGPHPLGQLKKSGKSTVHLVDSVWSFEEAPTTLDRCVLRPESMKRRLWTFIGFALLVYDGISLPLFLAFAVPPTDASTLIDFVTSVFWTIDIFVSATTGFYLPHGLELRLRRTSKRYMRGYFLFDFALVVSDWIVHFLEGSSFMRVLRLFKFLRLLRAAKFSSVLSRADVNNNRIIAMWVSALKTLITLLLTTHLMACGWYWLGSIDDVGWVNAYNLQRNSLAYSYTSSLHWALTQIHGSMEVNPVNFRERLYAVLVLLGSLLMFSSLVGTITTSLGTVTAIYAEEDQQNWILRRYLDTHKISHQLIKRIQQYCRHAWAKDRDIISREHVVLLTYLSRSLYNELQSEIYAPAMQVHPFLCIVQGLVSTFVECLSTTSVALLDVVFNFAENATTMYVIDDGTFSYEFIGEEDEMALEKGDWCSEMVLWVEWVHLGCLVAKSHGSLLSVNAVGLFAAVKNHAVAYEAVVGYAQSFLQIVQTRALLSDILPRRVADEALRGVDLAESVNLAESTCQYGSESGNFLSVISSVFNRSPKHCGASVQPVSENVDFNEIT